MKVTIEVTPNVERGTGIKGRPVGDGTEVGGTCQDRDPETMTVDEGNKKIGIHTTAKDNNDDRPNGVERDKQKL